MLSSYNRRWPPLFFFFLFFILVLILLSLSHTFETLQADAQQKYYFNEVSGESVWEKPEGMSHYGDGDAMYVKDGSIAVAMDMEHNPMREWKKCQLFCRPILLKFSSKNNKFINNMFTQ